MLLSQNRELRIQFPRRASPQWIYKGVVYIEVPYHYEEDVQAEKQRFRGDRVDTVVACGGGGGVD